MAKSFSIAQARNHFTTLVRELERQPRIQLTRRGKPVAVLLSQREYERIQRTSAGFWDAYGAFRSTADLQRVAIDPRVFRAVRDASPGRERSW